MPEPQYARATICLSHKMPEPQDAFARPFKRLNLETRTIMQIRVGYEIVYDCVQPTPMVLMLHVHHSRVADIVVPDHLVTEPALPVHAYHDAFGNWCSRIVAPAGRTRIASTAVVNDAGLPDPVVAAAQQHAGQDLPGE